MGDSIKRGRGERTFLGRLARDTRGNTLAMMAIALIPICAIIGSGIDMARLYVVKVRLQQACDAGVLAGRKSIVNTSAPLDVSATGQAKTFFRNNFKNGWMRTSATVFTPTKTTDNQVNGTATVNVPMTIIKMFAAPDVGLSVACQARYDVADTDIMFVLDTTGSMSDKPDNTGGGGKYTFTRENGTTGYASTEASSDSKIAALRSAVLNFYDTLAATADASTHIRYGFVPYSVTVNAGAAIRSLDPSYLVNSWNYNTREPAGEDDDTVWSTATVNTNKVASADCATGVVRTPATGYNVAGSGASATATAVRKTTTWAAQTASGKTPGTCTVKTEQLKVTWTYKNKAIDVSQIKTGAATVDPTRFGGGTIAWSGCIEERETDFNATSFNLQSLPADLDPDLIPTSDDTRWKPALPELSYWRGNVTSWDSGGKTASSSSSDWPTPAGTPSTNAGYWVADSAKGDGVACPKAVQRLATLSRSDIETYVSASGDLRPSGYTYHDAGMIWGTRMIAPDGPFAADTAAWPNRNAPNRYIVFMTDGDMNNLWKAYSLYGIEYYDKRVSGKDNDESYHNARFATECSAAKARGITVFVVAFGQTLTTQLTNCASPGQAFQATNGPGLETAFQNIAKQIASLRISQ